jgi:3-oxoacyl-[acyl-carrier-protein] synthase II
VGTITRFDASGIDACIAAEVKDFVADEWIDRRESRRMDLYSQYAMAATDMAMKESGLPIGTDKPGGYIPEKVGVIIGSGIGGLGSLEEQHKKALEKGFDRLSPFFILQMIINMAPGLVTIKYGAKGPNWSPVSACSTSAHAIGEAAKSIRIGETDAMIAGGAEAAITPLGIGGFAAMKAPPPATMIRPTPAAFDKDRDGFVEGEGDRLEELEHAGSGGEYPRAGRLRRQPDAHHVTARRRRVRVRPGACAWPWPTPRWPPRRSGT